MESVAAFSRSGVTSSEGKCDTRIDVPCNSSLEEKLIALSVMANRPRAEYARMLLTKAIEGEISWLRSIGKMAGDDDARKVP